MSKVFGLAVFWVAADFVASFLPPGGVIAIGFIILAVVLAVVGSSILSWALDEEVNPLTGFLLAFPGWLLTEFVFHWHLNNPAAACDGHAAGTCGSGAIFFATLVNCFIVAIGTAIIAIPVVPLIKKARGR